MPRTPNRIETQTLKISTTPHVLEYLQQLIETGLYGKNVSEAAHMLITRSLDEMLAAGRLVQPLPASENEKTR